MPPPDKSGRVRRRRRRRLRLLGRAFYALGALLLVVGAIVVLSDRGSSRPRVSASASVSTVYVARPDTTTVPSPAVAVASTVTPGGAKGNTPPVILAPRSAIIGASGPTAIEGLSLADHEARDGDTFGVLALSAKGTITLGRTSGVQLYGPNGSHFLPFSGPLDSIKAALASLKFTPDPGKSNFTLVLLAIDYGHQGRFPILGSRKDVVLEVRL